jgi:hypothetical protein
MAAGVTREVILTARTMAVDQVTAEAVTAFDTAGIPVILLKGPSIAAWLYPEGGRAYGDSDLLVRAADLAGAGDVLRGMGFERVSRGAAEHAHTYLRDTNGVGLAVDLHRGLPYVTIDPRIVWDVLNEGTEELTVHHRPVRILGAPQRALHLCIHAVQHVTESTDPLEDLRRGIVQLPEDTWRAAATVAASLGAEDALATGLRLLPEGARIAERLELTTHQRDILRVAVNPEVDESSYRLELILGAASTRQRLQVISDTLFVSPNVMRRESGVARHGPLGLAAAYVARPFVLMARIGPAAERRRRMLKEP